MVSDRLGALPEYLLLQFVAETFLVSFGPRGIAGNFLLLVIIVGLPNLLYVTYQTSYGRYLYIVSKKI